MQLGYSIQIWYKISAPKYIVSTLLLLFFFYELPKICSSCLCYQVREQTGSRYSVSPYSAESGQTISRENKEKEI